MRTTAAGVTAESISCIDLFSNLSETEIAELDRHIKTIDLRKNDIIIKRGDYLDGMYGLAIGKMKIYLLTCNGHERVVRILNAGESFGEAIMFNHFPSPVQVEALSGATLIYISAEHVKSLLQAQPGFSIKMMRSMSYLLKELMSDLETCCLQSATQRIATYLNELYGANGEVIMLPSTKVNVASKLNLTAESFSRGLHHLSDAGAISIRNREITITSAATLKDIALGYTNDACQTSA